MLLRPRFRWKARPAPTACRRPALATLAVAFLLCSGAARAALDRWEPYPPDVGGPWGGSVRRLAAAADGSLWAGTAGGVYAWDGAAWSPDGLQGVGVNDLAACPDGSVLWAATDGLGLQRSVDGAGTWVEVDAVGAFVAVAVAPGDCDRVFAVAGDGEDRLWFSEDGGASWTDRGAFDPVSRMIAAPNGDVFFGTQAGGVYRVTGAGVTERIYADPYGVGAEDLAASGTRLAVSFGGSGIRVFDLADPAAEPLEIAGFAPDNAFAFAEALAFDPVEPDRLVYFVNGEPIELYEIDLTAAGPVPARLDLPEPGLFVRTLLIQPDTAWLGANEAGVFLGGRSTSGFEHASRGLAAFDVSTLAFSPDGSGDVAAGGAAQRGSGNGGPVLWDAASGVWARVGGGSLPAGSVCLATWVGGELWVGVDGLGLFSTDGGGTGWADRTAVFPGLSDRKSLGSLAFDPGRPDVLATGGLTGLYRTENRGATWVRVDDVPSTAQRAWQVVALPGALLAAGRDVGGESGRVYRSTDGGSTWAPWNESALPPVLSVAASRRDGGRVLAGTSGGLWVSGDGGRTWVRVAAVPADASVDAVAMADAAGDPWMAAFAQGVGVFETTDGGTRWDRAPDDGLLGHGEDVPFVAALVFEPGSPRLIAAVANRGLWYLDLGTAVLPTGTVAVKGGSVGPGGDATLTFTASAGVVEVRLSDDLVSWSEWQSFAAEMSWTPAPGDGTRPVYVRFRDGSSEESATYSAAVVLPDTTPPVPELAGIPDEPTDATDLTVVVGGEDVAEYRYALDGGPFPGEWTVAGQPIVLEGLAPGDHRLAVEARDEAGNTASVTASWTVTDGTGSKPPPSGGGGGGGGGGCFLNVLGGLP